MQTQGATNFRKRAPTQTKNTAQRGVDLNPTQDSHQVTRLTSVQYGSPENARSVFQRDNGAGVPSKPLRPHNGAPNIRPPRVPEPPPLPPLPTRSRKHKNHPLITSHSFPYSSATSTHLSPAQSSHSHRSTRSGKHRKPIATGNANDDPAPVMTPTEDNVSGGSRSTLLTSSVITTKVDGTLTTMTSSFATTITLLPGASDIVQLHRGNGPTTGVIVGVVISVAFILMCLAGGLLLVRRRRIQGRRTKRKGGGGSTWDTRFLNIGRQTVLDREPHRISPSTDMRAVPSQQRQAAGRPSSYSIVPTSTNLPYLTDARHLTEVTEEPTTPPAELVSVSAAPWLNGYGGRRAIDAGPVSTNLVEGPREEGESLRSTLPPDYTDVFSSESRSPTVSSVRRFEHNFPENP